MLGSVRVNITCGTGASSGAITVASASSNGADSSDVSLLSSLATGASGDVVIGTGAAARAGRAASSWC